MEQKFSFSDREAYFIRPREGTEIENNYCFRLCPKVAALYFLDGDDYLLSVNIPFLAEFKNTLGKRNRKSFLTDFLFVALGYIKNGIIAGDGNFNVIHNLKSRILTHGLNLRDYLTDVTLLDKLGGKVFVYNYGNALVALI